MSGTDGGVMRKSLVLVVIAAVAALMATILAPASLDAAVVRSCGGKRATIVGTQGADRIIGTPGDDVIVGLGGPDVIFGLAGNDTICGLSGHDTINGGDGNDRLIGGKHHDTLNGGRGNDILIGNYGRDTLNGGKGNDILKAGHMRDILRGGQGRDLLDGGFGNDYLDGQGGSDSIFGNKGSDRCVVDMTPGSLGRPISSLWGPENMSCEADGDGNPILFWGWYSYGGDTQELEVIINVCDTTGTKYSTDRVYENVARIYNRSKQTIRNVLISVDFMLGNESQATGYISRSNSLLTGESAVIEFNTYDSFHNGGSIEFDRCRPGDASYDFEA